MPAWSLSAGSTPGARRPRVVVFGPSPLLEVSIEGDGERIEVLPGGQCVWVARMAATMGSRVTVVGLAGEAPSDLLSSMLRAEPFESRLVPTGTRAGRFVVDQRQEPASEVAAAWAVRPSPADVDALVAATLEAAERASVLVVCNPMPGDALPLETYERLVGAAADMDVPVLVDLSSPRLDAALRGGAAAVKVNDWELAELVRAPVAGREAGRAALDHLLDLGARGVVVTRGPQSVVTVSPDGATDELHPPQVGAGRAAGCGDAMTGAMAAVLGERRHWLDAVRLGMAAGAAHYRGRGESSRDAIEALSERVAPAS